VPYPATRMRSTVLKGTELDNAPLVSTITSAIVAENVDAPPVANPVFSSLFLNGFT
jgi:hypothetical protein